MAGNAVLLEAGTGFICLDRGGDALYADAHQRFSDKELTHLASVVVAING